MFFWGAPGFFARMAIPGFWGAAAVCFIAASGTLGHYFSPAALADDPGRAAQAMPLLIGQLLPTVVLGVLMAGLMAAFMSTHDSYLLAWASVISQDIIGPLKGRPLTSAESIRWTRISVLAIGLFLLTFGVWMELPESVWTYMSVTGTIYLAGAATSLVGGLYWRRASSTGAFWALLGGIAAVLALFEKPLQNAATRLFAVPQQDAASWINSQTIALCTYVLCLLLFIAGSLLYPDAAGRPQEGEGAEETAA